MTTKIDLVNDAYAQLRISGLTVVPGASENVLALNRLENMMAEFLAAGIAVDYVEEDVPVATTEHKVNRKYWQAIAVNLAFRLCLDFGKQPTPLLLSLQRGGYSFLLSSTANNVVTQYPSRFPTGSGNYNILGGIYFSPSSAAATAAAAATTSKCGITTLNLTDDYQLALTDLLKRVIMNSEVAKTILLPVSMSEAYDGYWIDFFRVGSSALIINSTAVGVSLGNSGLRTYTMNASSNYSHARLSFIYTINGWVINGYGGFIVS